MDPKKHASLEPIEREYRYRLDLYFFWATPIFLGFMSGFAVYFALTNSSRVRLQGSFEIPASLANVGAWFGGALFACLFVANVVLVIQALTHPQRIALTATALLVPRGSWSSAEEAIPYRDIVELVPQTGPDGSQTLIVRHRQGKFPISESLLPSKAAFQELCLLLTSRVGGRA